MDRSWHSLVSQSSGQTNGAGRGNRTPTVLSDLRILSPLRLPISPSRPAGVTGKSNSIWFSVTYSLWAKLLDNGGDQLRPFVQPQCRIASEGPPVGVGISFWWVHPGPVYNSNPDVSLPSAGSILEIMVLMEAIGTKVPGACLNHIC